ncbi:terminase large subunit domain-containing protein [Salidesulfovibrio onnuriiensis]|uniref:terminase large subunit domain-containing protein n=1 Tax=Salidesulfovibrio onnuriiensis TaxID=2583823 RepID=UPI00202ACA95|nr:terminase family protein [Salidesulfovibrio onnuriiensis]
MRRFSVLVCHRRFGKTVLSVNRLIREARETQRPDWRGAYIAPLYKQAKAVVWDYLKHFCGKGLETCDVKFNETELRADFENGARIRLFGANNPDSLRGLYLDAVVFDEVAQMPYRVWSEVVRPALSDRKGWGMFIGTPQGKNALYRLWRQAQRDAGWNAAMYRASETDVLEAGELEAARREMAPEEYEQEFECSFSAAVRGPITGGSWPTPNARTGSALCPTSPSCPCTRPGTWA